MKQDMHKNSKKMVRPRRTWQAPQVLRLAHHKGFGLVEALIALVIIALTMIAALETVSSSLRQVKNNETENKANELMTSALEYAYGYRNIDLPGGQTTQNRFSNASIAGAGENVTFCYKSTVSLQSNQVILYQVDTNCPVLTSADTPYLVAFTDTANAQFEASEEIFHQVIITNQSVATVPTFLTNKIRITSIVVYVQEGQIVRQRVDAYRPLNF